MLVLNNNMRQLHDDFQVLVDFMSESSNQLEARLVEEENLSTKMQSVIGAMGKAVIDLLRWKNIKLPGSGKS
jgi:hypothetical protein